MDFNYKVFLYNLIITGAPPGEAERGKSHPCKIGTKSLNEKKIGENGTICFSSGLEPSEDSATWKYFAFGYKLM